MKSRAFISPSALADAYALADAGRNKIHRREFERMNPLATRRQRNKASWQRLAFGGSSAPADAFADAYFVVVTRGSSRRASVRGDANTHPVPFDTATVFLPQGHGSTLWSLME